MKYFLAALLLATPVTAQQIDGSFNLQRAPDGRIHLNIRNNRDGRGSSNWGRTFERSALAVTSQNGDHITFTIARAPGVFTLEGRGNADRASGWFAFQPNATFRREIEALGFRGVETEDLFVFALDDLTTAKVRQLLGLVADPINTDDLVRMINHGAGVDYVQSMTDLGFRNLTVAEYVRARDHGVTPRFAQEMRQLGMQLPLNELIRSRDHGVTAEYARAMRSAGHDISHDAMVRARDHGVSTEFIAEMTGLGYGQLALDEYIRMRDHGVTSDFVESMQRLGYKELTVNELVKLRDHGITVSYVRRTKELFKELPTVDQLIRYKNRS